MLAVLVLASTSPRRRELVRLLDLEFQVVAVDVDESPLPDESPKRLVTRLSRAKAAQAAHTCPGAIVVAADTLVSFRGHILGKPQDPDDARRTLRMLRGTEHTVLSGFTVRMSSSWAESPAARDAKPMAVGGLPSAVVFADEQELTELTETTVWMRDYSDAEIETYIATGDPLDKAAAYAVQHRDFSPVARVAGCYANVMGLPLCHLHHALRAFGVTAREPDAACQRYLQIECPVAREILNSKF